MKMNNYTISILGIKPPTSTPILTINVLTPSLLVIHH